MSGRPDPPLPRHPALHLIVPGALEQRTGGYLYDARMVAGLRELGWDVTVRSLPGAFPEPDARATAALADELAVIPEGARVLLDGLAFAASPEALFAHAERLDLLGLVHHLISDETDLSDSLHNYLKDRDRGALELLRGVIVTSPFTARRVESFGVSEARIRVVVPGTDRAAAATGPAPGEPPRLLCVGSLIPRKGQDVLVRALARLKDQAWSCVFAGSLERDPRFARQVRRMADGAGLSRRVLFAGECDEEQLDRLYRESSAFVLSSRYEGYGMALTEALSHGLPIVSTTAGAIPETVPAEAASLVPPDDAEALAGALRALLEGGAMKRMSEAALRHAETLPDWPTAVELFAEALLALAPERPATGEPAAPAGGAVAAARFDAGWLALREPADHRARAGILLPHLRERWRREGWSRVLDLGSGTGSNLRYLAPRLPGPQHWTLVDRDAALLRRAEPAETPPPERTPPDYPTLDLVAADLAQDALALVSHAHLVTASALLDLVSEPWLQSLVDACSTSGCGALLVLNYDGRITWEVGREGEGREADAYDGRVRAAVNAHQRRDKGLGPALGPTATFVGERLFRAANYQTWIAPSPWRLSVAERKLATALVDGWERAAAEQRPGAADQVGAWAERRRRDVRERPFLLEVGHLDLLALPLES